MINTKKVLLIIFCILIPLAAISSCVYLVSNRNEDVLGISEQKDWCVPYIINEMPRVAYVGQEYYFFPIITGCSLDNVTIEVNGIEWLRVTEDMGISGTPSIKDIGTYEVEITVYGVGNSYSLTDYIIVKEYEE